MERRRHLVPPPSLRPQSAGVQRQALSAPPSLERAQASSLQASTGRQFTPTASPTGLRPDWEGRTQITADKREGPTGLHISRNRCVAIYDSKSIRPGSFFISKGCILFRRNNAETIMREERPHQRRKKVYDPSIHQVAGTPFKKMHRRLRIPCVPREAATGSAP